MMFRHLPEEIEDLILSFGNFRKYQNLYIGTFSKEDEKYMILHDLLEKKMENYEYNFIWHNYNYKRTTYRTGCIVPCNLITAKFLHIQKITNAYLESPISTSGLNNDYDDQEEEEEEEEDDAFPYKSKFNIVRCFFSKHGYFQDSSDLEDIDSLYEVPL